MTSRERVSLALQHKEADRVAIHDSPWGTTVARWHKEGLPEGQSPAGYFGFEFSGVGCNNSLQLPTKVIEDTDEYTISTTPDGATRRNWKGKTSTPELIDFSITTREDWEEHKPRMVMNESRVDWENQLKANRAACEAGYFCTMNFGPGFTKICNLVGPERTLIAMIEEPNWVKDMFLTDAQLCADIAEEMMGHGCEFHAGWIFDDLGFKHKGFFSTAIGHQRRFAAQHLKAREILLAGEIGELRFAWISSPPPLIGWGTHVADLARYYLGDVEFVMGQIDGGEGRTAGYLQFTSGLRALFETESGQHRLHLFGEDGEIEVRVDGGLRVKAKGSADWTTPELEGTHPFRDEVNELVSAIEEDREHLNNGREGRAALEVLMAILESSRSRKLVTLPLEVKENPLQLMKEAGEL